MPPRRKKSKSRKALSKKIPSFQNLRNWAFVAACLGAFKTHAVLFLALALPFGLLGFLLDRSYWTSVTWKGWSGHSLLGILWGLFVAPAVVIQARASLGGAAKIPRFGKAWAQSRPLLSQVLFLQMFWFFLFLPYVIPVLFLMPLADSQPSTFLKLAVGMVLVLLLPLLALSLRLFLALPVVLFEKKDAAQGMVQSWRRTRGHFWSLVWLTILAALPALAVMGLGWSLSKLVMNYSGKVLFDIVPLSQIWDYLLASWGAFWGTGLYLKYRKAK